MVTSCYLELAELNSLVQYKLLYAIVSGYKMAMCNLGACFEIVVTFANMHGFRNI